MYKQLILFTLVWGAFEPCEAQVRPSELDSLNEVMQLNQPLNMSKYGKARIELKYRTIFLNCIITEVTANKVTYKKGGAMHDEAIDKIKAIEFEDHPLILTFDEYGKGTIKVNALK